MGRVAALILALAATGLLAAGLAWLVFTVAAKARAAYLRWKHPIMTVKLPLTEEERSADPRLR